MLSSLFPNSAPITPSAPEEQRADFSNIPAKCAVYLLTADAPMGESQGSELPRRESPVLLATVGDLRAALRRRLADTPPDIKSKRIPYAQICTRVHYRVVHSAFAANFYYAAAARALFPETAAALIPWRDSWWIAVEAAGTCAYPRFRKTNNVSEPGLRYAGPIRDKHAANRLVESLEDLFDLCRYHTILVQAPQGKPCAYKEMGKCPAPCDGSTSLDAYQVQIEQALAFLSNGPSPGGRPAREQWRSTLEVQMKAAAAGLQFETAGKIKQRLTRAGLLATDPFAPLAAIEDFAFLTLQPGQGKPWVEPWLVHFGTGPGIQALEPFHMKTVPTAAGQLAERVAGLPAGPHSLTAEQSHHAALVAHHLFRAEADHGVWLRLSALAAEGPGGIIAGVEGLRAKKAPKALQERSTDVAEPAAASPDLPTPSE